MVTSQSVTAPDWSESEAGFIDQFHTDSFSYHDVSWNINESTHVTFLIIFLIILR